MLSEPRSLNLNGNGSVKLNLQSQIWTFFQCQVSELKRPDISYKRTWQVMHPTTTHDLFLLLYLQICRIHLQIQKVSVNIKINPFPSALVRKRQSCGCCTATAGFWFTLPGLCESHRALWTHTSLQLAMLSSLDSDAFLDKGQYPILMIWQPKMQPF